MLATHRNRITFLILAAALFALSVAVRASEAAPHDGTWIDVRTPAEYAEGHVSFARNIPHEDIVAGVAALDLPRDEPIYLYCGSGRRAGIARDALLEAGYTDVTNLGGLDDARTRAGETADP